MPTPRQRQRLLLKPSTLRVGLFGDWPLSEVSGTRFDRSGQGNDLTDNNTVTQNPGRFNNAAQFTAANLEYLNRADNASLSTGDVDFSYFTWVYLDSLVNATLAGKYFVTGNQREWIVYFNHTDHAPNDRFALVVSSNGTATTQLDATTFGAPSTATWVFVGVWHDSVQNTLNIQINDGVVDSVSYSSGVFDGTAPFQIGIIEGSIYPMNGRMQRARFYKRVLTAQERHALFLMGFNDYA